jgi:hypothetical protein
VREISEDLRCSPGEVQASMTRMLNGVTPDLRAKTVELELARLDALNKVYYAKATADEGGNHEACALVLRIMERRARLLGLDAPPRGDTALDDAMSRPQPSVDRILAALDRLRGPVIDAEPIEEP